MTRMRELRDLPVNGRAATRRRADHELRHQSWARSGVASVCRMIRAGATGPLSLFGCRPLGPASAGDSAGTRDAESRAERSDRRSVPERYWHSDWPPSPRRVTKFTEAGCRGGDHDDPGRSGPAECRPVWPGPTRTSSGGPRRWADREGRGEAPGLARLLRARTRSMAAEAGGIGPLADPARRFSNRTLPAGRLAPDTG